MLDRLTAHGFEMRAESHAAAMFEIRKIINGVERESISHEIDHAKEFNGRKLALEIEWIAAGLFVSSPQQVAVELRGNNGRRVQTRVTSWSGTG